MPNPWSHPQVLLLSNEPERTATLRSWLDTAHFTTTIAAPGDDAVTVAEAAPPDAIVLHVAAPGKDVLTRCEHLRDAAATHLTPLLVWSERPFTHDERIAALQAGAWDCLAPGTDRDEMLARLHTFVRATRGSDRAANASGLIDPATGLYNRHGLARRARELNSQAFRDHSAIACVAFSLDIADGAADEARTAAVMARCAHALSTRSRLSDVIGRLGPREFAVLAPATGPEGAVRLAHRMVEWVTAALAADPQAPAVRVRAGYDAIVNVAYEPLDPTALLLRAATALRGVRPTADGVWLKRFEETRGA
ncbi:MAG TPA: diguanylate cyclase [Gemmatimonadales bacterium]